MKNFKVLVSFLFLSFTLFQGCQKENISISESFLQAKSNNEEVASFQALEVACNPTFPTITTSSPLFQFRYNIALYRFYAKIYTDFKLRVPNGNPFAVTITDTDLARLGLKELILNTGAQSDLVNIAREHYKGTTIDAWGSITAFLTLVAYQSLSATKRQAIVTKSNSWGDTAPNSPNIEGSYTIFFSLPTAATTYSGKGGGTGGVVDRCLTSANARCPNVPTIADAQKSAPLSTYTLDVQAFKEEAVRMFTGGFTLKGEPGNTLNSIQSPGVGYINSDGI
jgi:hypothetical protein